MCSRSHGTPPNWSTWVSSWAQTQRPKASASTSRSRDRLVEVRADEQEPRRDVAREQRHVVLAQHAVRQVAGDEPDLGGQRRRRRRAAARPPAGRRSSSRSSSRAATGIEHVRERLEVRLAQPRGSSSSAGGRALPSSRPVYSTTCGSISRAEGDHVDAGRGLAVAPPRDPAICRAIDQSTIRSQTVPGVRARASLLDRSTTGANRSPCSSTRVEHVVGLEHELRPGRPPRARPRRPASTPSAARARAASRRRRSSCARRSGSSRPAPCPCAAPSSARDDQLGVLLLEEPRERVGERLGAVVVVDLAGSAARRPGSPWSRTSWGSTPGRARRACRAAAAPPRSTRSPRRRPGIEVEDHHGRALDARDLRQRRVQLEVGQVGEPDQRRQVVADAEVDRLAATAAPCAPSRARATGTASRRSTGPRPRPDSASASAAGRAGAAARPARCACSSRSPGPW